MKGHRGFTVARFRSHTDGVVVELVVPTEVVCVEEASPTGGGGGGGGSGGGGASEIV